MVASSRVVDEYAIETVLVDSASAGAAKAESALNAMERQAQKTAEAVRDTGAATGEAGGRITAAASSFDRFANRVDDVTRAQTALGRAQDQLRTAQAAANREIQAGSADIERINRTLAELGQRVQTAASRLGDARAEAEANAAATAAMNARMGQGSVAFEAYTRSVANGAQATRSAQIAMAAAASTSAAATSTLTTSAGGASAALRNLSIQGIQAASGIATGQPAFQVLVQQGHQVADSMLAGGQGLSAFAAAGRTAFSAVGGLAGILAVGVVGGLVALTAAAEGQARHMEDLRQSLRATKSDYAALADVAESTARRVAATSTLSTGDARDVTKIIQGSADFHGTAVQLEELTRLAGDMARVFGTTVPEQATKLAQALKDPAAAAKALAEEGFGGMTAAAARTIERLQASGNTAAAQDAIIRALGDRYKGAADAATPLQKALHDLDQAFTSSGAGGKSFGQSLGEFVAQQAGYVVRGLTNVINLMKEAKGLADSVINSSSSIAPLIDAATGAPVRASADLQRVAPDVSSSIYRQAEALGVRPQVADLATIVAYQESRGRQVDSRTGQTLTSSAGALGIGQLMPATAASLGVDPHDAEQNIRGMLLLLKQLDERYGGKLDAVAAAYNGGPGRADAYLAGQPIPAETAAYVRSVTGRGAAADASIPTPPVPGQTEEQRRSYDRQYTAASSTLYAQQQDVGDQLRATRTAQGVAGSNLANIRAAGVPDPEALKQAEDAYARLTARVSELTGKQNDLITAAQQFTRSQRDQLPVANALTEGQQKLAEVEQQLAEKERSQPGSVTPAVRAEAIANALKLQSAAYNRQIFDIDLSIEANQKITAAYGQGYAAVAQVTAETQAYAAAIKLFPRDSDEAKRAAEGLTAEFRKQAQAGRELQVAQATLNNKDQLDYLQAETRSLGLNDAARAAYLAHFKAEQDLKKQGIALESQLGQAYLASVDALSVQTAAFQRQKAAMDELSGFFDNTFKTIGDAITQAFATGELKALKFGDLAKSVASAVLQEFVKLAVLNPLKNAIFGTSSTTLGDVGGLLGGLFGNGGSIETGTAASFIVGGAAGAGLLFDSQGNSVARSDFDTDPANAAALGQKGVVGANGSISLLTAGSVGLTAVKGLDFLAGGKLLSGVKDFVFNAVGYTPGTSIGAWVSGLIGEQVTSVAALGAADAAGITAAGGTAVAAGEIGVGAIGSAVNVIAEAIPYIGAAITIITDIATGNYRGAAIVATTTAIGAAIGSVIPAVGTAIGAAVGATIGVLIDAFLPNHPKNPYQDTEVDFRDGHIVTGKTVSQIETTDKAEDQVTSFSAHLDAFMQHVGIRITNADGLLGHIGEKIVGLEQFDSIEKLFNRIDFAPDPNAADAKSNFGVARGALVGMRFDTVGGLTDQLVKIANFADGMDQVGIKLASVSKGLTNIQVASVSLTGALNSQATISGAPDPLRVALAHDLPGKTFATVEELGAEIDKVNTFVNATIPGLLSPVAQTNSQVQQQIAELNQRYGQAMNQAAGYGLDTKPLATAQEKADDLILAPYRKQLDQGLASYQDRAIAASPGAGVGEVFQAQLRETRIKGEQERDALIQSLKQVYGDSIVSTKYYFDQLDALQTALGTEEAKQVRDFERQRRSAALSLVASIDSVVARAAAVGGNQQAADLINFDAKAAQERDAFSNGLVDFYGEQYRASADYQKWMTVLEQTQQAERLAIVKKYGDEAADAVKKAADEAKQASDQAAQTVRGVVVNLADYARGLQTSALSPLSPQQQLELARGQFQAVAGAASAGDYDSVTKLQSYTDTFLNASRAVNGSGLGYVADFLQAMAALDAVGNANPDTLTASYMASIATTQTDRLVDELRRLQDEVKALRLEVQQGSSAPARLAA